MCGQSTKPLSREGARTNKGRSAVTHSPRRSPPGARHPRWGSRSVHSRFRAARPARDGRLHRARANTGLDTTSSRFSGTQYGPKCSARAISSGGLRPALSDAGARQLTALQGWPERCSPAWYAALNSDIISRTTERRVTALRTRLAGYDSRHSMTRARGPPRSGGRSCRTSRSRPARRSTESIGSASGVSRSRRRSWNGSPCSGPPSPRTSPQPHCSWLAPMVPTFPASTCSSTEGGSKPRTRIFAR
jgi:hypothetical protein